MKQFMEALEQLQLASQKNFKNINDNVFINSNNALKHSIPQQQLSALLNLIAYMLHLMQSSEINEFQVQQSVDIIMTLNQTIFLTNQQSSILLVNSLITIAQRSPFQTIPSLLMAIGKIITLDNTVLSVSTPRLCTFILDVLTQYHQSKIQHHGLTILANLLQNAMNSANLSQQDQIIDTRSILNLISQQKQESENMMKQKINEFLIQFLQFHQHSPTPKLCNLYQAFILNLMNSEKSVFFFTSNTLFELCLLYCKFNNHEDEEMIKFNKSFAKLLLKSTSAEISINLLLQQKLKQIIYHMPNLKNEINSSKITTQLRYTKWLLIVLSNQKIQNMQLYNYLLQYFRDLYQNLCCCLNKTIRYQFNPKVIKFLNIMTFFKIIVVAQVGENNSSETQINNIQERLDLELLPILNNDPSVRKELHSLFFSLAKNINIVDHMIQMQAVCICLYLKAI